MSHKIYGQQVLFIEEDNPIVASTPEEIVALLTSDNVGKFVKYIGETRDFELSTPTGRNIPVNPVAVDNSVEKWYFDTSVAPDFTQFAWSDLSSSETESITLCTVAVPGTTSGDKYILSVTRFPKGSRFASSWPQLKEDAYTIHIPYTSPAFKGYVYVSTEELAYQIKHTGANPPQVHQGWMVKQGTWNINDYGWWVTNVSQQDVWGGYISKDGQWTAEVINTNLSLVKDAFYKISEETDIVRYYELPALSNEGTAEDLAEGKELINSNGEKIVGTASGGGGQTTGDYFVKVIDYDGTVLLEKRGNNGDSFDLPTAPTHDRLVFQEWSASVAVSNNKVTIADNDIMVGAVYTTTSGKNEFDITLTKVTGLSVTLNMDGTKDWGDGTSDTETTHTYTAYGDYTILCDGTKMTTSSSAGLFGQSSGANNDYCTRLRFAGVTSIGSYACYKCYSLTNITIPSSVTSIRDYACFNCCSLTDITIPNGVTSIGASAFKDCYSLTNITIPNSVKSIESDAFSGCHSLTSITIPSSVTSIRGYAFGFCYSLTRCDFSRHTSIPTLVNTGTFTNINAICKIIVPDNLYDRWIAASNWSTYADYIYKASEVA